MKTIALAGLALLSLIAVAQAQATVTTSTTSHYGSGYPGTGSWGSGVNSGYGTGTGYAYSPASGYFWGYPWRRPCGGRYPGYGLGYGWGAGFGGSYYGGYSGYGGQEGLFDHPFGAASTAGPMTPAPAVDRSPEMASARELEEGRRRFRSGDYRAAVDSFRSAVAAHPENPVAQAWFAVGLIALGEGRNADKALRSATGGGLASGAVSLEGMFRDDKERVRLIVALAKVGSEGSLASAYALALSGEPVRLKQLAEKDPVARQLLPKP
jgi:hypothetical protein